MFFSSSCGFNQNWLLLKIASILKDTHMDFLWDITECISFEKRKQHFEH